MITLELKLFLWETGKGKMIIIVINAHAVAWKGGYQLENEGQGNPQTNSLGD